MCEAFQFKSNLAWVSKCVISAACGVVSLLACIHMIMLEKAKREAEEETERAAEGVKREASMD